MSRGETPSPGQWLCRVAQDCCVDIQQPIPVATAFSHVYLDVTYARWGVPNQREFLATSRALSAFSPPIGVTAAGQHYAGLPPVFAFLTIHRLLCFYFVVFQQPGQWSFSERSSAQTLSKGPLGRGDNFRFREESLVLIRRGRYVSRCYAYIPKRRRVFCPVSMY